ncbi:MAG: hypothetical protein GKR89_25585 [Candidatus Latescibacteria bacterium]|nr:hypothetical protein [Candidatus Latescibacterota bacterium]
MQKVVVMGAVAAVLGLAACDGNSPVASTPAAGDAGKLTVSAQTAGGTAERPSPQARGRGEDESATSGGDGAASRPSDLDGGDFIRSDDAAGGPPPRGPERGDGLGGLGGILELTDEQAAALAQLQTYRRQRQEEVFSGIEAATEEVEAIFPQALERILTPEQAARWEELQNEPRRPVRPPEEGRGGLPDILDFSDEQRAQYEALLAAVLEERQAGAEELQALEAAFRADLEALFTDEQLAIWQELVEERTVDAQPGPDDEPRPPRDDGDAGGEDRDEATTTEPSMDPEDGDRSGGPVDGGRPIEIEPDDGRGGGRTAFLTELLGLSTEQVAQIEALEAALEEARQAIFDRVSQVQKDFEADIDVLLTQEQAERLAALRNGELEEPAPEPVDPQVQRLAFLTEELGLDGEQVAALEEALQAQSEARLALRREFGAILEELDGEYQAKLAEILTPEQLARLQQGRDEPGIRPLPADEDRGGRGEGPEGGETAGGRTGGNRGEGGGPDRDLPAEEG